VCDRAGTSALDYTSEDGHAGDISGGGFYKGTYTDDTSLTFGPQTGPNTFFGGDAFPTGPILTFSRTFVVETDSGITVTGTVFGPTSASRAACGPGTTFPILDGTYFEYTASYTATIETADGVYTDSGSVAGVRRRIIYDGSSVQLHGGQDRFTSSQPTTTPVPDAVPPVVTGMPDRPANAAGWHNAPVTINWSSVDPIPSSGTPTDPPDSIAQTEGQSLAYTSGPSCDPAGHRPDRTGGRLRNNHAGRHRRRRDGHDQFASQRWPVRLGPRRGLRRR
jgi:hypothetical protein